MMGTVAFMLTFMVGGMTGMLLAVPPADFVLHNNLFPDRPLPQRDRGGVVFAIFCRHQLLVFPKPSATSSTTWGVRSFWRCGGGLLGRIHAAVCGA